MKKSLSLIVISSLFFGVANLALAQNQNFAPSSEDAISDGVYDVAGHPELKVRVFVHHLPVKDARHSKPGGGSSQLVCNIADPDSSTVTPVTGWHLPTSVTYSLNTGSAPSSVGRNNLSIVASNAFTQWMNAVGGKVQFSRGTDTTITTAKFDGLNLIAWGHTSGSALAVTYTWYNQSTGLVSETDTIFNSNYPWNWSDPSTWTGKTLAGTTCAYTNAYDAEDILTHETGHWMGLNDTYTASYSDNTMFGYGNLTETKKDTLASGDISGVQSIYK